MRYLIVTVIAMILAIACGTACAKSAYQSEEEAASSAQAAFEEILDLWRDGRYDDLYDRTQLSGKVAREDFARRLEDASTKPACCWQKLQDVTVHVENNDFAVVRAKIGLEGDGDISYKTRSYKLVRERNVWRISQADLFYLAGAKKKRSGKKR